MCKKYTIFHNPLNYYVSNKYLKTTNLRHLKESESRDYILINNETNAFFKIIFGHPEVFWWSNSVILRNYVTEKSGSSFTIQEAP